MRLPYLAIQFLLWHRVRTIILLLSMALTICLPVMTQWMVHDLQSAMHRRAEATPLVIGSKGSRFDLVLHALYLRTSSIDSITTAELESVEQSGHATAIPLLIRHAAASFPIVATTAEYGTFRNFRIISGSDVVIPGDCVLGANVARKLKLTPGDYLPTDQGNIFQLTATYPLNLLVVGILAPLGTPDDDAIFVDLKTGWILEGLLHGHEELGAETPEGLLLEKSESSIRATGAIVEYRTITPENMGDFHFHGDEDALPLTAIIALPKGEMEGVMLRGRYQAPSSTTQALRPAEVVGEMIEQILRINVVIRVILAIVLITTLLFLTLVFSYSLRIRASEFRTLHHLGCNRGTVLMILLWELLILLITASTMALVVCLVTKPFLHMIAQQILLKS